MSREEIKIAISELLDDSPDIVLNEILDYLRSVSKASDEKIALTQNLRRILSEDRELLQRLAQ